VRDLATESIHQYGSRAGVWRLARLLDEYELACTFFAAAVALELNPAAGEYIHASGHVLPRLAVGGASPALA
jgi:hypothetical protein